jgi:hypothetical protein
MSPRKDAIYATCRDCSRDQRRIVGRGLCGGCYDRHWNAGTLDQFPRLTRSPKPIPTEKTCAICGVVKPLDEFARNNRRPDGRGSYCRPCAREKYQRPAAERNRLVERPPEGEQRCRKCGEVKPYGEFHWRADAGRFRSECKVCWSEKGRHYWKESGTKKQRTRQLRKYRLPGRFYTLKYRLGAEFTEVDYDELLVRQGGGCAICRRTPEELGKVLSVDHCHTNGHVRGLLCSTCNFGLGQFKDDLALLAAAIEYLKSDEMRE